MNLTPEQRKNASTIIAVGKQKKASKRAITIAIATALVESELRNVNYGDRDSLGLFQQRPSQGWGTPAQVQNATYAAGKFFDTLFKVPGWESLEEGTAAQAVQRSAFPLKYRTRMAEAREIVSELYGGSNDAGSADTSGDPGNASGSFTERLKGISDAVGRLDDPDFWRRVLIIAGGVVLLILAVVFMVSQSKNAGKALDAGMTLATRGVNKVVK